MRKAIETNNGLKGGFLKGKAHYDSNGNPLGGIKAVVTDQGGKAVELESSEVIINKKTVQSDKVLTVKGTPKEILSTLNQMDGNGVAIGDEEAEILAKYRTGGSIPKEIIMYHGSKSKFEKFNMINNTLRGIELGSHFGTYEQAKSFMSERYGENDKFYIYKCKLNLENTLKVDDIGWWTADNIYRFILKNKRYKLEFNDIDISTPENILKILKEKNIDSFKYSNLHEGEGYSYLVFDSSKIEILDTEIFRNGGELIKRADGSYSRRGLWDNIRDNVGSGRKPTKQMLEQEAKIKDKYHLGGDMTKHLAPNGKPSNLNHEQWHLVRTPEFKSWFGDWEKAYETLDYDNVSKVLDENGEPLVVYHGTNVEFNIFEKQEKDGFNAFGEGFYFTDRLSDAESYGNYVKNVFLNLKSIYNIQKNLNNYQQDLLEKTSNIQNKYDGVEVYKNNTNIFVAFNSNQIKLADGTNTTFDGNNPDIRFAGGGSIKPNLSKMTPSELKEFYASPEGKKLDAQTYAEWKRLVNMTKSELEKFYNSFEGKKAGLSSSEANRQGIDSGRESARWIMKMKDIPYTQWTSNMWRWAKKQINFIKRMSGMKGSLYNDKGEKTRKHTALLIWGHNPEQKFKGGGDVKGCDNFKNPILINGFISNKEIDGKEIFLITYNSGGQEGLNVHQTMNPLAMLDAVEKKTGLHTNTLQVFIYEHTENSNRIETQEELEFLKDNYTVIIVDRDSVEFYNGDNRFKGGGYVPKDVFTKSENERNEDYEANWNLWTETLLKNENLPIHWTTSESRKELYGDSFYITIFNEDWQEFAKLRFSGHSVMNTSRLQNEFHNPKISRFYEIVSRAMNKGQQDKHPEKLVRFKGGGELSKKALAVETNDLTDFVRKYFISDGRIDVSDAMQELFGNKGGKSIADEYRKRIGLHKKGGLTISQLAHNLWEQHRDEVREGIDDSDFRNAVEEVLISEYGVSSMIKSLMEKSEGSEQDNENEYWMNQFDEGNDEYYEDLSDEEVADYFKDMEGFERETYKDEDKKIIISGVEIPKEIDELFKEQYKLSYYYSFYGDILNSFPKDEMGLTTDSARATKEYKDVKQKYDLAKRKANEFNLSKEGKELSEFYSKIDRMSRIEIMKYYRDLAEELAKGTEHEMEHLETLKKVAEREITPEQAVVETAKTHIKENPNYYEDLQKMELEALKDKLKNQGYNVTIPSGGNRISVIGYGKGYFNAKKQKADSILSSLKRNGYNAVSKLDADGYYDFWVYADEPKQDLAKMEAENKETYTYALTLRPFDIGTYPMENFIRLVEEEDNNYRFGLLEYSKPLSDKDIQNYSLAPVSELYKYDGVTFDYFLGNLGKANIKRTEGNIPYVDVDLYDKDTNELVETYDISGEEFLRNIGKDWKIVGDINPSEEESIPDLIEGLKVLADSLEGAEKKEIEDVIEGLEILLESDDKFAKGGEFRMATGGKIVFKPITTPL